MKGRQIIYSATELDYIRSVSKWTRADAHAAYCQKFGRDDVTLQNFHALCKRKGWYTGRTGCIEKGAIPHNKGKKMPFNANSARTQFQKGQRTGIAQENYKPIGYERITEDGYRERKINDDLPFKNRWQLVQRIEWEAANGPIPDGFALKCLNGDRLNTDPSNWEPVHRGVLARLNGGRFRKTLPYDAAPAELKPTVMAVAKLKHAAHELRRAQETPTRQRQDRNGLGPKDGGSVGNADAPERNPA